MSPLIDLYIALHHGVNSTGLEPVREITMGFESRSADDLKVSWPRPHLEIHLRYVRSREERAGDVNLAGPKSLVWLSPKSCSEQGEEEVQTVVGRPESGPGITFPRQYSR